MGIKKANFVVKTLELLSDRIFGRDWWKVAMVQNKYCWAPLPRFLLTWLPRCWIIFWNHLVSVLIHEYLQALGKGRVRKEAGWKCWIRKKIQRWNRCLTKRKRKTSCFNWNEVFIGLRLGLREISNGRYVVSLRRRRNVGAMSILLMYWPKNLEMSGTGSGEQCRCHGQLNRFAEL